MNRGMSGGASHNSIQFVTIEKLQESPTVYLCNALTSAQVLHKDILNYFIIFSLCYHRFLIVIKNLTVIPKCELLCPN